MSETRDQITVYYDGACPLCRREIGLYQRSAGGDRVGWCDVSGSADLPKGLTREQALARFHVTDADGKLVVGARAFIALWLSLPRWRWAGRIASVPPLPHVLEFAYRGFLKIRPWAQRAARRLA
ncbi:MAG: thiol-disulfide oxidoreductase DCC family protein [Beijerinckiaceae bacterium]